MATRSFGSAGKVIDPDPLPPGVKDYGAGRAFGPPDAPPLEPTDGRLSERELHQAQLHGVGAGEAMQLKLRALQLEAERFGEDPRDIRGYLARRHAYVRVGLLQPTVQIEWSPAPAHELAGMSEEDYSDWSGVRNANDAEALLADRALRSEAREEAKRQLAVDRAKQELSQ